MGTWQAEFSLRLNKYRRVPTPLRSTSPFSEYLKLSGQRAPERARRHETGCGATYVYIYIYIYTHINKNIQIYIYIYIHNSPSRTRPRPSDTYARIHVMLGADLNGARKENNSARERPLVARCVKPSPWIPPGRAICRALASPGASGARVKKTALQRRSTLGQIGYQGAKSGAGGQLSAEGLQGYGLRRRSVSFTHTHTHFLTQERTAQQPLSADCSRHVWGIGER